MKHTKSEIRSTISNEHLENSLRIATTSIEPTIDALVSQKQSQIFHVNSMFMFYVVIFSSYNKKYNFIMKNIIIIIKNIIF